MFRLGQEVIPVGGPFVGFVGQVNGFDPMNPAAPWRVEIAIDGQPAAWYSPLDLMSAVQDAA